MALQKYCFCYDWDVGITILGFLQMNAMLFFWARFAQLEDIYCWLDLGVALCYTVRTTFFIIDLAENSTPQSKQDYFLAHSYTMYVLCALAVAICTLEWVEWAWVPTWIIVGWVCCVGLNIYHYFCLKEYAEASSSSSADSLANLSKVPKKRNIATFDGFDIGNKME